MTNEDIAQLKKEWLEEKGLDFKDVLVDDDGDEYVLINHEMDEEGNGDYFTEEVYLPDFKIK